jgi:hypothetical protein
MTEQVCNVIRNRVEPKPLPKVKQEHLAGVFGHFEDVIDSRIVHYEASKDHLDVERVRFYRHLLQRVDAEAFGRMQEFQLADGKVRLDSDIVKYIDPTMWFESKLLSAWQIGLDKRNPINILDIGTGPAHFPVVAEFYGHSVLGTDLPYRATGKLARGHLYDALADIYEVRRVPLAIAQFVPFPAMEERYDLVTAFLAAFNLDSERKPWTIEAWNFFLRDLRQNVLTANGEVFMSLTRDKITPDVWRYLSERASYVCNDRIRIHIIDLEAFA